MLNNHKYIDPFIGVDGAGSCICGPYLPLGIVRLSPDTLPSYATNGYETKLPILHFSHNHVSGTGGASRYGNIGVIPFTGYLRNHTEGYERESETAECGYYSVILKPSNISAELTTTPRVGVHRYTFEEGSSCNIKIDVGAVIQPISIVEGWPTTPGESTAYSTGGFIEVISETEIIGRGDYKGGWGHAYPYSVHFYAKFDQPFHKVLLTNHTGIFVKVNVDGSSCNALINFEGSNVVNMQVGISYVSVANARSHVEKEVGTKDFDTVKKDAKVIWEKELSPIRVEGGSEEEKKLFYTSFSRLLCMPSDLGIDDEYVYWKSGVRHFSDFYCLWDSVRNANSLISLFNPRLEADILNCMLDVAEHRGWFPDAWIAGHSAFIQGGSSVDILFCEASLKGLKGIDYEKALKYMRKNYEVESPNPDYYGRHLKDYKDRGFVSTDVKLSCVSRHLEYSYQDWCIGVLSDKLGYTEVAKDYFESSTKVWNLWSEEHKSFVPKNNKGEWIINFDPTKHYSPYVWIDPYFYEGTSMQWSFSVHHDFNGLIDRCGGADAFVERLDNFFDSGSYHSKETMLHIPYLYIYAGRPDKTAERVRTAMSEYFQPTRDGLADNEDMGCQSAFFMCSAMGLYPIMGQDIYLLTSPVFTKIEIELGEQDKILTILAPQATKENKYVKEIRLNGIIINRAWLKHQDIAEGGVLEFELTSEPFERMNMELPNMIFNNSN